jgi:hypothetical protein
MTTPSIRPAHDWVKDFRGLGIIVAVLGSLWGIAMLVTGQPLGLVVLVATLFCAAPFFAIAVALRDRRDRLAVEHS